MGSVGQEQFEYVHYHDGGVPGCRPILTGKHAKSTFNELPMIDMRRMFSSSLKDRQELAAEVGKACREVGFFYALNHDVPDEVIDSTFDAVAKFFALPEEVKMEVYMRNSSIFRGYEPMLSIQLDPTTRGGKSDE
jgi:isopenicillin N synthase-like dioxygenase